MLMTIILKETLQDHIQYVAIEHPPIIYLSCFRSLHKIKRLLIQRNVLIGSNTSINVKICRRHAALAKIFCDRTPKSDLPLFGYLTRDGCTLYYADETISSRVMKVPQVLYSSISKLR